jgi:hypothetical protein
MSEAFATYLRDEHRALLAALDEALAGPSGFDPARYASFRAQLLRHMAVEERLVVSPLRARQVVVPDGYEVRVEHAALAALLAAAPDAALAVELRALLTAHCAREEAPGGLFEVLAGHVIGDDAVQMAKTFPDVKAATYSSATWLPRTVKDALDLARGLTPPPHPHE